MGQARRKETRVRAISRHVSAPREPVRFEWASEKQKEVFQYGPYPQCASGGFGSAKTWAFCLKALTLSLTYPRNRGVIARREYEMLKHTTMSTFFKICPPEAYDEGKRSDSEKYLRLNNGSEILWMHMDDPETENVIRGLEINWFLIDQAEEVEEEIFDMLMTRLGRWDKAEVPEEQLVRMGGIEAWPWINPANGKALVPTYPMLACNPDTELHWIYRRFHPESSEYQEKWAGLGYRMWTMRSDENRFLPKQNLDLMLEKDQSFVRRFVRGEWGIPDGQIHKVEASSILDFDPIVFEYLLRACTLHRALDHGDSAPTCCLWFAVDREGNIFVYREYYRPGELISYHRERISELSSWNGVPERYQLNLADPSIFIKTMQKHGGRWSIADEYADCVNLPRESALFWQPGDNNELGTRNRVNEYLRPRGSGKKNPVSGEEERRPHPISKELGYWPRLFFIKKCESYQFGCDWALRQTRSARRKKIGTDNGRPIFSDEREESVPDHAYDPLRYFIASRPAPPTVGVKRYGQNTFAAKRKLVKELYRRGAFRIAAERERQMWENGL